MALTQVSTKGLKDGTILNADVNASAAIAGTKISPDFGSQNIASTGQLQVTSQIPAFFKRSVTGASPVTVLIGNNTQSYALEASSTGFSINDYTNINVPRLGINSSGNVFIGSSSSVSTKLHIENASGDAHIRLRGSANYGILFTRHSDAALTGYVGSGNAVNLGTSNVALSAPLSGGDIIFQTNGTAATDEKMRIKSNGAISFTSQNATGWQLNAGDDSASYSAIDNHFPTTNRTLYFNAETTHRSVAFWNKNGSDGYGFGLDNSGNFKVVAGTLERLKVASDGLVTVPGDLAITSSLAKIKLNDTDGGDQFQIRNDGGNFKIRNSTDGRDDISITNNALTFGGVAKITDNNSIFFGNDNDIEMRHNATSGQNQIISKNHDFLLQSADSIYFQILASGNSNNQAILTLQNTAITSYRDIRIDRGTAGVDGIVGQAYAGYFGLKHADQTINQEYMILNNGVDHTFISTNSGAGVYIRPDANSVTHQTFFAAHDTTFNTNVVMNGHALRRSQHQWGHLEGGYNNIGGSDLKSNPIFTIGSAYNPAESALQNMYGIGYCTNSASFINNNVTSNWGMYVAADGDARVFLGGSDGRIFATTYNRTSHETGHLEGGHNNISNTDTRTSPIYTIGSAYNPAASSLSNMYGVGFSHGNASFTPSGAGWGMYVAADGDSRIYLDGSYGNIHLQDNQGSLIFANDGWSGDRSTGKIQTYLGHMYLQNAGNTASWAFRLPSGTEPFVINYQGGTGSSDRRLKKDITTITGAVDTIKKLIGRSFTWKEADVKGFGVIAQEIEPILPEVISTQTVIEGEDNDDPYKMMNYGALSGHFIEAIKELAAKIEALETEVATLKAS